MHKIIIFTLTLLATNTFSQSFEIKYGNPFLEMPQAEYTFFNTTQKKAYLYGGETPAVYELNNYLEHGPKPIPLKLDASIAKRNPRLIGFFASEGKNYLVYAAENKERNADIAYLQEINTSFDFVGSAAEIVSFKTPKGLGNMFGLDADPILKNWTDLTAITDSTNDFLILVKRRIDKIEVVAYHPSKGKLWEYTFALDTKYGHRISSMLATSDGTFYLGGSYYDVRKKETVDPFVFVYSPISKNLKVHTFNSGEKIVDLGYEIRLVDNTVFIGGLYSKKNEVGYKIYTINPNDLSLKLLMSNVLPKPYYDVIYQGAYTPEFFNVGEILKLENGNLVIGITGGAATHLNNFTAPVFLTCLSSSGLEQWNTIIYKYQLQPLKSGLLGHKMMSHNNKVYLLYNDNLDNFEKNPTVKTNDGLIKKNIYIAVVEVDESGKAQKINAFSKEKKQRIHFYPFDVFHLDENLYHMKVVKDGKLYFATVALP